MSRYTQDRASKRVELTHARLGFENIHGSTCKGSHLGNQVAKGVRAQICVSTYPVSGWRLPAEQSARFDARSPPRLNNPTQLSQIGVIQELLSRPSASVRPSPFCGAQPRWSRSLALLILPQAVKMGRCFAHSLARDAENAGLLSLDRSVELNFTHFMMQNKGARM